MSGKQHIIIAPYNSIVVELCSSGFNAMTLHKLLGLVVEEGDVSTTANAVDISDVDVVCFDEVYLHNRSNLWRIKQIIEQFPDKLFVATGDPCQNKAVHGVGTVLDGCNRIINLLFPKQLNLSIPKRLVDVSDRQLLPVIKAELFDDRIDPVEVFRKHFRVVDGIRNITTKRAITYTNKSREKANEHIHTKVMGKGTLSMVVGEVVLLKKHIRGLSINCRYKIIEMSGRKVKLHGPEGEIVVSTKALRERFDRDYANTGHGEQGLTIAEPFTIVDINHFFVTAEWLWTAITRAKSLGDITGCTTNKKTNVVQCIEAKLKNYMVSDRADGRYDKEHFVTTSWVMDQLKACRKRCQCCPEKEYLTCDGGDEGRDFSVDRIDSERGHTMDNCQIICWQCNRRKKKE